MPEKPSICSTKPVKLKAFSFWPVFFCPDFFHDNLFCNQNHFIHKTVYTTFAALLNIETSYKKLTAIILIAAFLAQSSGRLFIIADYYANTTAYAKNCINKAFPKMHCNGKCQMMKKIALEEKKDQDNTDRRENLKNQTLSSKSFFANSNSPDTKIISTLKMLPLSNGNSIDRCFDIFHPPQA